MARAKKSDILSDFIREKDPDTGKLAELVAKAKGKRSVTEFALKCGVNPSTMSRLINGKNNTASSDDLIVAIALNADPESGVTFQELVNAHGLFLLMEEHYDDTYIVQRYKDIFARISLELEIDAQKNSSIRTTEYEIECRIRDIITRELMDRGYTVALAREVPGMRHRADFIIATDALEEENLNDWSFEVKCGAGKGLSLYYRQLFGRLYINSSRDQGRKETLVVCDKITYQSLYNEISKYKIWDCVSLMWVDIQKNKIMAEYVIPTKANVNQVKLFTSGEELFWSDENIIMGDNE